MKKWKFVAMALSLSLLFTACSSSDDDDKNTSSTNSNGVVEDVVSDIGDGTNDVLSDVNDVVNDVISGTEDVVSDITHGDDDKTDSDLNSGDTTSKTAALPAAGSLENVSVNEAELQALDNASHGWGQGKDVDDANRPTSCLTFQEQYGRYAAQFIGDEQKEVYLTFDEGYENGYTAQILDVLKEKECPAVFFVTMPYVKENPDLIQRMIDEGHVVGNHTVNHPSMPSVSLEQAKQEIAGLHDYVSENFHYQMTLFRPPRGEWSERTLALTQKLGYDTIFWSFAYQDWEVDAQPDKAMALEKTVSSVHDGAIYLLHAVSSTNTAILGDFIDQVRAKGYTFATLQA